MKKNIIVTLFFIVTAIIMILGCAGCDDKDGAAMNPEQVVEQFIDALQKLDLEKAKTFLSSGYSAEFEQDFDELSKALAEDSAEADAMEKMFDAIFNNSEFIVTGHSIDGENALVNMENNMPDMEQLGEMLMGRLFELMFSEEVDFDNMTEDEEMTLLVDVFVEVIEEVDKVAQSAEIPMIMEDGQWKINGDVIDEVMSELDF